MKGIWIALALMAAIESPSRSEDIEATAVAPRLPRFDKYTVKRSMAHVPVKIEKSTLDWDYRTRFRQADRQAADFSANGVIILWGCGTQCATGAWIDRTSGRIYELPVAGEDYRELDLRSMRGSNLILSTWLDPRASEPVCMFGAHVWNGKRFKAVPGYPVRVSGRCPVSYTYR